LQRLIAPILVWREVKGMRKLAGLRGIPMVIQQLDRLAFVMEYLPADRLARKRKAQWPNPDWARLAELIAEMHERGVAHCDLRRSSNILFSAEGEPFLVDFAGHVQRGARWNVPWNWAFERFMRADRTAIGKLKQRVAPEKLSADEKELLTQRSRLDHAARSLGIWLRKIGRALTGSDGGT
jgi:predicted Ser/Thr protein kinase